MNTRGFKKSRWKGTKLPATKPKGGKKRGRGGKYLTHEVKYRKEGSRYPCIGFKKKKYFEDLALIKKEGEWVE